MNYPDRRRDKDVRRVRLRGVRGPEGERLYGWLSSRTIRDLHALGR